MAGNLRSRLRRPATSSGAVSGAVTADATGTAPPADPGASGGAPAAPKWSRFGPPKQFGAWLARPMTSFHLIVSIATLLVLLGLIMVLSASGVHSYDEDGSPWVI